MEVPDVRGAELHQSKSGKTSVELKLFANLPSPKKKNEKKKRAGGKRAEDVEGVRAA